MTVTRHLVPGHALWPAELDPIPSPPGELWMTGPEERLLRQPRVAVVGTRSPTPYGVGQARRFAGALARAGVTVVSGLARGIDQAAHAAALDEGGTTIAVLGSGVDRPWPAGPVTERVRREGVLLSEFPPGRGPRRHHFPLRNRLIAGLCAGVLVVEAAHVSGSLITAHWANDQGREVFALPGRVDHPMARGVHRLLREGATLVEAPQEILACLGHAPGAGADEPQGPRHAERPRDPVLAALVGETLTADELASRLGWPVARVLASVSELELAGALVRAPGGLYRLAVGSGRDR